jgi:cell division protein FtsA
MDTRIGYPNEHLAGNSDEEISSPLYATVGLVMKSIENKTHSAIRVLLNNLKLLYTDKQLQNPVIEKEEEEDQNQMRNTTLL